MKKRILSILISVMLVLFAIPSFSITASAADYAAELRSKGFPESYIPALTELHKKYPNWNFEVLNTNEDFSYAVSQERRSHSQQLIQKYSGNNDKGYYCECSSCYKNGNHVVHEGSNWVSASETAVRYYLDPRNFLDEKYIFQFESTKYNSQHTQAGVESILEGTWMHNANITYKDASGKTVTYSPATRYSKAIMDSAKASGLSAYYIAAKIVQEVGGKTNTAGGASGTYRGYPGIYNYYNICAYTGAGDGIKWAASSTNGARVQSDNGIAVNMRSGPSTSSSIIVSVPSGTSARDASFTPVQSDGYKWVKLTVTISGKNYTGYVRSDFYENGTDTYNRPWTNPYLSIYNGAKWIANNYATQFTGYLQKFNVNPASSSMHSHEYMANVQAAASEAAKAYSGYQRAGILNNSITFTIPVFRNMPNDIGKVSGVTAELTSADTVKISYNSMPYITGYQIQYKKNGGAWTHLTHTTYISKEWTLDENSSYEIRVRTYNKSGDTYTYQDNWSDTVSFSTKRSGANIPKVKNFSVTNVNSAAGTATVSCTKDNDASGYQIQISKNGGAWEHYVHTGYWSREWAFEPGYDYKIRMRAYDLLGSGKYSYSNYWSDTLSFSTKRSGADIAKVKNFSVTNVTADGKATVSCDRDPLASGYQIQISKNGGAWEHYVHTGYWSREWQFELGYDYKIRMRAYDIINGRYSYSNYWSDTLSFSTKAMSNNLPKVKNFKLSNNKLDGRITISCDRDPMASGYQIQIREKGGEWKHYVHTGYWSKEWTFDRNKEYEVRMRTYILVNGQYSYSDNWSDTLSFATMNNLQAVKRFDVTNNKYDGKVTISCDREPDASGYQIQIKENDGEWKHYVHTGYWSKEWSFDRNKDYKVRMRSYIIVDGKYSYSSYWSQTIDFSTKRPTGSIPKVQNFAVTNIKSDGKATVSCTKDPMASGYQIQIRKNGGAWEHYVHTGYWSKEWQFEKGCDYEIRMRAYDLIPDGNSTAYSYSNNWSDTIGFSTK